MQQNGGAARFQIPEKVERVISMEILQNQSILFLGTSCETDGWTAKNLHGKLQVIDSKCGCCFCLPIPFCKTWKLMEIVKKGTWFQNISEHFRTNGSDNQIAIVDTDN
jgi:hypothetical protein